MRLYSPVDLIGKWIMIEKLVLGGTRTGEDLPIFRLDVLTSAPSRNKGYQPAITNF